MEWKTFGRIRNDGYLVNAISAMEQQYLGIFCGSIEIMSKTIQIVLTVDRCNIVRCALKTKSLV